MEQQFLQKIFFYIKEQELIGAGDMVLAGVSGGADSMCLLEVLCTYQKQLTFDLRVVHVEHGIRGADSLADASYVQQFCENRKIPCEVVSVDAPGYSAAHGLSVEEAARILRYEAFEQAAQGIEADHVRIAVAHHMEDQAETMLWQMIRGSDIKGMGGMRAKRGRIIRPLLAVGRAQIEEFLREHGIRWREDRTNCDGAYTRNRLRMEVLPVLSQLNAQAVGHLCESARRLQETEDYLATQTELLYGKYTDDTPNGGIFVDQALLREPVFLQRRVLYRALGAAAGRAKDLGARHIELLRELFSHQVGRELMLPYGVRGVRDYEGVQLLPECPQSNVKESFEDQIHMEVLDRVDVGEISKKKYTKWFDYDKIECNVQIRRRQSGDYLTVDRAGHRQKLKNYLVNEKIPKSQRDELLLLADGSHIMWVVGHRISDYYKIDEHTKHVLKVQYDGGKEDE